MCRDQTVGRKEREQLGGDYNLQARDDDDSFSSGGRDK